MNRSNEACHSWQTGMSEPRGGVEACTQCHTNLLCLFLPPPHLGWRLPLWAAWTPYPTCHKMMRARLSPNPNKARKTSRGHQSPLRRQYFPPILFCLSCPPWAPKASLSHTSSSFSPHKSREPQGGVLVTKHLALDGQDPSPGDRSKAWLPGETFASQLGPSFEESRRRVLTASV